MKKHLIAAAVAAAVAVPAAAQITVSGRLDQSFQSNSNVGTALAGSGTTQTVGSSLLLTNQLVFSGSEDLGGGLKASFVLATNIGSHSNDGTAGAFSFGDRGAQVTVSGGFGAISIGKADNSDANRANSGFTNLTNFRGNAARGGIQTNARPSNHIGYASPSIQGLTIRLGFATNANNASEETTVATTKNNGRYSSAGLSYAQGPLSAMYFQAKQDTVAASVTTDVEDSGGLIGYNFGFANVGVRYVKSENSARTVDNASTGLDISVPLGNGLTVMLGHIVQEVDLTANADSDRTVVVLRKDLSKRTFIYGAAGTSTNETASDLSWGGSTTITPGAGRNQTGYAIGVVHNF